MKRRTTKRQPIDFMAILPHGKENAISAEHLCKKIGAKDTRALRDQVAISRLSGQLICSGGTGYYIPATRAEVKDFVLRMEAQAKSTFAVLRTARKVLREENEIPEMEPDKPQRTAEMERKAERPDRTPGEDKARPPAGSMEALRNRLQKGGISGKTSHVQP